MLPASIAPLACGRYNDHAGVRTLVPTVIYLREARRCSCINGSSNSLTRRSSRSIYPAGFVSELERKERAGSEEDAGQAVGRRGGWASPGDGPREAPQGRHPPPARHRQRRGRRSRGELQADAVDAVDPDDAGDAVVVDDDAAARRQRQRVAQRVPPGEQPGHQGHGRQPLRPPGAKLPHRLRLALQRRDQEQPPLDRMTG